MNIKKALEILDSENFQATTQFVEYEALRRILKALQEQPNDQ